MGSCTIRRDEYDVDEDSSEDACGMDDSKYDATSTMLMRIAVKMPAAVRCDECDGGAHDERRRKQGWNCGPCRRI